MTYIYDIISNSVLYGSIQLVCYNALQTGINGRKCVPKFEHESMLIR